VKEVAAGGWLLVGKLAFRALLQNYQDISISQEIDHFSLLATSRQDARLPIPPPSNAWGWSLWSFDKAPGYRVTGTGDFNCFSSSAKT